eukprot:m.263657 g.263657  ORF g.263657 m.263657 type:complete len:132 (+) comp27121_c0_seq1:613-1008(+)
MPRPIDPSTIYDLEFDELKGLMAACYSNIAMCLLKMVPAGVDPARQRGLARLAHEAASQSLQLDPLSLKALFRRARALHIMNDFAEARADLQKVLQHDPDNTAAQAELAAVDANEHAHERAKGAMLSRMFR